MTPQGPLRHRRDAPPGIRPHRRPPDARIARRYLLFCLLRGIVIGLVAAAFFIVGNGPFGEVAPFAAACGTAVASCLLVACAAASGLARRPVAALVPAAFGVWCLGVLAAVTAAARSGEWGLFMIGCVVLLACRPPLRLRDHLGHGARRA